MPITLTRLSGIHCAQELFEAAPFGILITAGSRPDDPISYVNPAFCAATGYSAEEVLGLNPRFLQGPQTDPAHVAAIQKALSEQRPIRQRILNYRKDGSPLWHELAINPMRDASGRLQGFIAVQKDVTEIVAAQAQALETRRLLDNLTDNLPGFVSRRRQSSFDQAEFVFFSRSLNRLLEVDHGPATLEEFLRYVHPDDVEALAQAVLAGADHQSEVIADYRLVTSTGREVWIRASSRPQRLSDGEIVWDACCIDVTREREAQERLAFLRNHDPLTGLPNRVRLEEQLLAAGGERFTLVVVEFDEIDEVRTVLGTGQAERLLHGITERLARCVNDPDHLSRLGEVQFALLAPHEVGDGLPALVQREFEPPLDLGDTSVVARPHLGLAQYPPSDGGRQVSGPALAGKLLRNAQMALHEARRGRADGAVMYDPGLQAQAATRIRLKQALSAPLDLDQFELEYQPLVDLRSLEIIGAEALVRWRHPDLGRQLPDVFVPIAEETGAIVQLGEWVMRSAIRQARRWSRLRQKIRVSVNVSSLQIRRPGFSAGVAALLKAAGLDGRLLEIELTETFLIESSKVVDENLEELRRIGVSVAIDDFGSGYSSLQYLTRFPAQRVKIDRSLVRAIGARPHGEAVIRGVLELARSMDVDAVFEGIESQAQLDFLRAHGAKLGQGYYFSPPCPAGTFEAALLQQTWSFLQASPPPLAGLA
ncbi:MAG TPA: EAL domain-containing protein [Caulobacteraceae bacterium]|nr:EAL domain-containing protein [Caulobacteraceae bacterium]